MIKKNKLIPEIPTFQHISTFLPRIWTGLPRSRIRTWMQRRQLREQKRSTRWVKRHCLDRSSTGTNRNDEEPTTTRDGIRATNGTVASNSIIKVDTIHSNSGTTAHNSILRTGTTEAHMEGQMQEVTLVAATAVITTGRAGNVTVIDYWIPVLQ